MKRTLLCLLVVPLLAALGGCEMSQEDRDFYGRGWIHPSELDKERPTQMPAHPETSGSLGTVSASGVPAESAASPNGGWTPNGY